MPIIITQGCISVCDYCKTKFSFLPSEVTAKKIELTASQSISGNPSVKYKYLIDCPNCAKPSDVESLLGNAAQTELSEGL